MIPVEAAVPSLLLIDLATLFLFLNRRQASQPGSSIPS